MQYVIGRTSRLGNRETNQDRMAILDNNNTVLLVLGDGLGGKAGGEIASETLVNTVTEAFESHEFPVEDPQAYLRSLIDLAHNAIIQAGQQQEPPIEPGTTAVLCLLQEGNVCWAHVGDSRLYLYRKGVPLYRTKDHSYVEKLYQSGQISLDMREEHPMRNVVTRCLGLNKFPPEATTSKTVPLQTGDIIMICSDGFWDPLDDVIMATTLQEGRLEDAINKLAERAEKLSYPNSDNITAAAVQVMSLQLSGRLRTGERKVPSQPRNEDSIVSAINHIQKTINEYEGEMKDTDKPSTNKN